MNSNKPVTLARIPDSPADWDEIERHLKEKFKRDFYAPLMRLLGETAHALQNAKKSKTPYDAVWDAMRTGRITFNRGTFSGKFSAATTKELRVAGAAWDRKTSTFKMPSADMPMELKNIVSSSERKFQEKIDAIDRKLAQELPEEFAGSFSMSRMFDRILWKADRRFHANVKGITVAPKLTNERRARIADEWQNNMRLYIKDFTEEQIKTLREDMKNTVFSGDRYGSAIKALQKSYGVSANKAKFLARQESKLLVTKFQEVRYADAGIYEYTWHAVAGTPAHPTRPRHKALADASKRGKIYRYDDPPVTTEPGEPERRNNPGGDYNCRCHARAVVRFKK